MRQICLPGLMILFLHATLKKALEMLAKKATKIRRPITNRKITTLFTTAYKAGVEQYHSCTHCFSSHAAF